MKSTFRRISAILSTLVIAMTFVLSSAIDVSAQNITITRDSGGNFASMSMGSTTYTDVNQAASALSGLGLSQSDINTILYGSYDPNSRQTVVVGGGSTDLSGYTYMSRSAAQALLEKYKNNEVFWGEDDIYYDGDPLTDFDNRISGTYHTYSSYKDATHQGVSSSQSVPGTNYSVTNLYSVVVESWDNNMSQSQYNTAISTLKGIAAQYNSGSTYDKVRNVAEYVATHISYDYSKTYGDIYHAVASGTGVCTAYAECFQLCMENMGIESYIFTDTTHALNVVNLDGTYYYVDTTNMSDSNGVRWQFFLFGTNMRTNHTYLPISDSSYDGYTGNYGISNIEGSERIESSEIQVTQEVAESVEPTEAQTEAPTEATTEAVTQEETTTAEIKTTTAATTQAVTTNAAVTSASEEESSSSGIPVLPIAAGVAVCAVIAGVIISQARGTKKSGASESSENKTDDDDSNGTT